MGSPVKDRKEMRDLRIVRKRHWGSSVIDRPTRCPVSDLDHTSLGKGKDLAD